MFVCKEHVREGLKQLTIPHVSKVSKGTCDKPCQFCLEKANFKVYVPKPTPKPNP